MPCAAGSSKNTQLGFITKVDTFAVIVPYTATKRYYTVQRDPPKAAETKLWVMSRNPVKFELPTPNNLRDVNY